MRIGRLHVITDCRGGRDPLPVIRAALSAGAPVVQVRAKDLTDRALYDLALQVHLACEETGATCVVDDRPDIALAVGAAGTHLGALDLPVAAARRVVGSEHLLGGTAREPVSGQALVDEGASYLGVGPAYDTTSKDGLPSAIGPAGIAAVATAVHVPVIAIGGITADRVPELMAAGAWGVAVISAISDAADPGAATRDLLRAVGS